MNKPNKIIFILEDNTRLDQLNESCKLEKQWYGEQDDGQILTIEDYYYHYKEFTLTIDFYEKTINEWLEKIKMIKLVKQLSNTAKEFIININWILEILKDEK